MQIKNPELKCKSDSRCQLAVNINDANFTDAIKNVYLVLNFYN